MGKPYDYFAASDDEKQGFVALDDNRCHLNDERHFLRCTLELPILDTHETLVLGVWIGVSKTNFYLVGRVSAMGSLERDLNEYLFHEFGMDGEESSISETWPFTLRPVGNIEGRMVLEFDDDEPFFALAEPSFDFLAKQGMSVDDLALQFVGSDWIAAQHPVSLAESRPGDDFVPSGIERRRVLEELGSHVTGVPRAEVLEGLFLRSGRRYIGLFGVPNELEAVVGGLDTPIRVGHARCSAWRRLAWGVGQWIRSKRRDDDAG